MTDEVALKRLEKALRSGLRRNPADHEARGSLAWCLLLRATVRMGIAEQEPGIAEQEAVERARALEECLDQAVITHDLAIEPWLRAEMRRVQALASDAGGSQAVQRAQLRTAQASQHLIRDVFSGVSTERQASLDLLLDAL